MSEPRPQLSFSTFVLSLVRTAAIHFGDLADSASNQRGQPNLGAATQTIEVLALLEQKTRGNLSNQERELLNQALYELRMRLVKATGGTSLIEP